MNKEHRLVNREDMLFAMIEQRGLTFHIPPEWKARYEVFLRRSKQYKEHIRALAKELV